MGSDMDNLEIWASIFLDKKRLINSVKYNVGNHKAALGLDIARAKKDYTAGKYFKFGVELGTVLAIVTEPIPSEVLRRIGTVVDPYNLTTYQYNEIIAGGAMGVIDQNDCTEIEACALDV